MEVPRLELLVVLEPLEGGLRDADDLTLQADVAGLAQEHAQVLQEAGRLEVLRDQDLDNKFK